MLSQGCITEEPAISSYELQVQRDAAKQHMHVPVTGHACFDLVTIDDHRQNSSALGLLFYMCCLLSSSRCP